MTGANFQDKSFSVCMTSQSDRPCSRCNSDIGDTIHKYNGQVLCRECWDLIPSKEGMPEVDNFTGYYDQQLGAKITSIAQKVRLLEKKGLHYSEDNPAFREKRKMAEAYLGKHGNRRLDPKTKQEFNDVCQKTARRVYDS